jgi:uncharacterized protein GlcG (DUF336 family)
MDLNQSEVITHEHARTIIRRAVAKAEALNQNGSFVVVDDAGAIVSTSRMDRGSAAGLNVSRAKAYLTGSTRETSAVIQERYANRFVGLFLDFRSTFDEQIFIGQGGIPIVKSGKVVGAMATGAEIGPFVKIEGVEPRQLLVNGEPTNVEDLIISYALGIPYQPQHGDDAKRWTDAFGSLPDKAEAGTGYDEAPPAKNQPALASALAIADAVITEAYHRDAPISVAVTDRNGIVIQHDRMDGAGPSTPQWAEAVARMSVNFRSPSSELSEVKGWDGSLQNALIESFHLTSVAAGLPLWNGPRLIGAVGVSGSVKNNSEIANAAVKRVGGLTKLG